MLCTKEFKYVLDNLRIMHSVIDWNLRSEWHLKLSNPSTKVYIYRDYRPDECNIEVYMKGMVTNKAYAYLDMMEVIRALC